ncbi:Phosphatidylinositol N-acetylglucosaminyltransferase subunit H [Camellia lanceoleosa]|uniref:Phosphatidylinositol N-acetylglucosaminyltransferase subunit H n=1 Tax=Camellia lanceoleosa TaxID=1840588 RepID=A0ACC0IIS8_9ERIC|nr:Phosphatidylinositol N-acetylglucosaminyltransferase subunit H [Camellia lanceoleosa]
MAAESCVANAKYTYIHDNHKGSLETLDSHHVVVRKSSAKAFIVYLSALLLTTTAFSLFLLQDGSIHVLLWSLFLSAFLVKQFIWKPVEKESIIIMPAFGVQLETHYSSGRIIHRFIPIEKILKPVLNECVIPVTCYWNLSLIVREEEELVLVFKELHPPVKMLIPIWKALCAATDNPVTQVPSR